MVARADSCIGFQGICICRPTPHLWSATSLCDLFVFQIVGATVQFMHTGGLQIHAIALIKFDILPDEDGKIINSTPLTASH